MAINKVEYNDNVLIDLTGDTVVESDVAIGKTFHKADGTIGTGTAAPSDVSSFINAINKSGAVNFPNGLTEFAEHAFEGSLLTAVTFPETLVTFNNSAFGYTKSLQFSTLPNSVERIEQNAFANNGGGEVNRGITVQDMPSALTYIGNRAFRNCVGLTVLKFYSTPSIHYQAFYNCYNITDIYVPWSEGEVADAPWGAYNATMHYDWTPEE